MPVIPLFGIGNKGKSSDVIAQRRINLYAEKPSDSDKSDMVLYGRPGLNPALFTDNDPGYGGGPIRGIIVAQRVVDPGLASQQTIDIVFGAVGNKAITSANNASGFQVTDNVFHTTDGPMIYADNGAQIMAVDGRTSYFANYAAGGYLQTEAGVLTITGIPAGATSVCTLAGRFIVNDPSNKGRFYWSAPLDHTSWNGLDFATAESFPDPLAAVYAWRGELILFGTQSLEFWAPTSDGFARTGGSGAAWGLVDQQTIQDVDGRLFFLARNSGSDVKVVALEGYQPQPISNPDVEYDINRNLSGAPPVACVIRKGGITFYVLNLAEKTWAYNATSGEWDEWQTEDGRFAGQYTFYAHGRQSVTDYRTAAVWGVDQDAYVDGDANIIRELVTRHVFDDMKRKTVWRLELDMETGVGELGEDDPQVMLQISRDGGHTFGDWLSMSLGAIGQYGKPIVWRRLGRSRDFVFKFRVADPVKVVFIGASIEIE